MVNIIVELSKYIIIILMAAYTFSCFSIFAQNYEDDEKRVLIRQDVLMFTLQLVAYIVMYLKTEDMKINCSCREGKGLRNRQKYGVVLRTG